MSDRLRLERAEFDYVKAVLERERALLVPTRWQHLAFWLFNAAAWAFILLLAVMLISVVVGSVAALVGGPEGPHLEASAMFMILSGCALFMLPVFMVPAFLLNLPLVLKLRRLARLRRRLGLGSRLAEAFVQARRRGWRRNVVTSLVAFLAVLALVVTVVVFLREHQETHEMLDWHNYLPYLGVLLTAASLFGLHFLRRGKERLGVLTRMIDELPEPSREATAGGGGQISISTQSYREAAQIEREQIIRRREASVRSSSGERELWAVQRSVGCDAALAELTPKERLRVEKEILDLMIDPEVAAAEARAGGSRVLPVGDSGLALHYDVDETSRQVHVLRLVRGESP